MQWRIFGGPAVGADGVDVELTSMQARLLGVLLVRANQPVSVPALIDGAWLGSPPGCEEVALRMQVARIRKRMRAAIGDDHALVTGHHAYSLRVATHELDVHRFETIFERATHGHNGHDTAQERLCLLEEALRIAQGEPLSEFGEESWASGVAEHWRDRKLSVEDTRFDVLIRMGRIEQAADELAEATAAQPYRERRWALRMIALYRSGRQADALRAFTTARNKLVEDIGVEPGAELHSLERAMLRHDVALSSRSGVLAADISTRSVGPRSRQPDDEQIRRTRPAMGPEQAVGTTHDVRLRS